VFDFTGAAKLSCPLALPVSFVTNMQAGGDVGFFLTAVDATIGYVFYSANYAGNAASRPALVVSAVAQPVISAINLSGTNLVLSATNGVAGETNYVLTSTDLALPPSQWTPISTNVLTAGGNFSITVTNAVNTDSQQFFMLQTR
jgi:hypothetical protein